ncbi:S8 family serine peptidase [Streptomyces sp. NPDC091280]|uniref:S8 family serine peptidase n=1 Tax=Streptomyces sp. NPDC091280 TaxID=3365984 RepID=UPI0038222132
MPGQVLRACLAAAVVASLVGLTTGASASPATSATAPTSAKGAAGVGDAKLTGAAASTAHHGVTLITGDRVVLDAKGEVVGVRAAKGREHVPFETRSAGGHTLVIPADAARMIAQGTLDQRLFDVTELNSAATRRDQRSGLRVIVGYRGSAATAARTEVRDVSSLRRSLTSLHADAVQTPVRRAAGLWKALTDGDRAASGVAHVWLDAVRVAAADPNVTQIGAPTAWKAGYTGKGVKIAVLDTGIDTQHPDLKGQVVASKNFSTSPDLKDRIGHGTHVASIAAGTGAGARGKYTGVAPGAKILDGKVLGDDGSGDDSSIIAGMDWAAEEGADIVNLSLGSTDLPGSDPLENELDKLSEQRGILFVVAAGNEGEEGERTVDSPGSAPDALTVGAVDGKDKLAYFSSLGPTADNALKPDVTAPGVDITAAAAPGSEVVKENGEKPAGYVTLSGTSMATPHVAGAAAILKQEHPDWTFARLKAALMGSAKSGAYSAYQQGAGRIQVDKAIGQTVLADPPSLDFGVQRWPHTDDRPVTKQLTYRNTGDKDLTLTLSASATGPSGGSAPAGFLTLDATTLTVPAGGTAEVGVTVDARLGGTADGDYSGYVTATGGGRTVRTAMGTIRETQSYDLTLKYVDRAGPAPVHLITLNGYDGLANGQDYTAETTGDTTTLRVPKGTYLLDSLNAADPATGKGGVDWLIQPRLNVTKDTTVTVDLNSTTPNTITVPDRSAEPVYASVQYDYASAGRSRLALTSFAGLRIGRIGPAVSAADLAETWYGQWTAGPGAEYDIIAGAPVTGMHGLTRHYKASDLATVKLGLGSSKAGKYGTVTLFAETPDGRETGDAMPQKLPGVRTLHLSAKDAYWAPALDQYPDKAGADSQLGSETRYFFDQEQTFKGGRTYRITLDGAVVEPYVGPDWGIIRQGDEITADIPVFADGDHHPGSPATFASVRTTLYRNGRKFASNSNPLLGGASFKVPAGRAAYRLATSIRRTAAVTKASSRIDASWTFTSKKADYADLPVSTLDIGARTDLSSLVPAGLWTSVPVTVEGSASGGHLKSLAVYVSYDGGKRWTRLAVRHGRIIARNPSKGHAISFKYRITDKQGNVSAVTVLNAYFGK